MPRRNIPKKKLSKLVRDYLPEFVNSEKDYETFVAFMEAFYEYMEQERGQTGSVRNLRSLNDLDATLDNFVNYWTDTLAEHLPTAYLADERLVLKHMKEVYLAKGTEKSYRLLFRILFNEDIEIRYPGEQVLIASGANWREFINLSLANSTGSLFETEFTQITGQTSGATGIVERVEQFVEGGEQIFLVSYSIESKEGDFQVGEIVEFQNGELGELTNIDDQGEFIGDQGLLNTQGAILHDGEFYQSFSYVIRAGEPSYDEISDDPELLAALGIGIWSWRDIVKKILHPAGLLLFSEFRITTTVGARQVDLYNFLSIIINTILDVSVDLVENIQKVKLLSFYNTFGYRYSDYIESDDYGLITESVDEEEDYGLVTETVDEEENYFAIYEQEEDFVSVARIGKPVFRINYDYMFIPFEAGVNGWGRNISGYDYLPTANFDLGSGIVKEDFVGVYKDELASSETNIGHTLAIIGQATLPITIDTTEITIDTTGTSIGEQQDFNYDDILQGDLALERLKLGRDSYIYQRTV